MKNQALFTSNSEEWETPQGLFDDLNRAYKFETDVAASSGNAKCKHFYDKAIDGLSQPWRGVCWCNPPYGKTIGKWVEKAYSEAMTGNATTVMLLPVRTDTKYFHSFIYKKPLVYIDFLKGRLKFSNSKNSAPFPSMIVVFNARRRTAHEN